MGEISHEQCRAVCTAVAESGVGLAGCHGGMCDAFRSNAEWQFMTGGQWVAHPGDDGVRYTVMIDRGNAHPITSGLADFEVVSEQYYLHVDPANNVLASCEFPNPVVGDQEGRVSPCAMPTVWTRQFGLGRVFYTALGHRRDVLEEPSAREILRRGLLWAAKG
jgi:type 1 glutamine amidotransferase